MVTSEQIQLIISVLTKIADKPYAITGASDWPILVVVGGGALGLIGLMWRDLKAAIRDYREEWRGELRAHKEENEKAIDVLWQAHRDCQNDCCPRKKE